MHPLLSLHRYLVWLEVFLTNIDQSHPRAKELLKKGGIAVARSLIPGALSVVDKTMEETFMKFGKSAGTEILLGNIDKFKEWRTRVALVLPQGCLI